MGPPVHSIDRISVALEYIEDNIRNKCHVADIASAACCSLFHFSRLFNQLVGLSPYDYLVRRRLSCAAPAVLASRKTILEIALDYQFETGEGFSRAFRKMFGSLPSEVRDRGELDERLLRPPVRNEELTLLYTCDFFSPARITIKDRCFRGWGRRCHIGEAAEQVSESLLCRQAVLLSFPPDWRQYGLHLLSDETSPGNGGVPSLEIRGGPAVSFRHVPISSLELFFTYFYSVFAIKNVKDALSLQFVLLPADSAEETEVLSLAGGT